MLCIVYVSSAKPEFSDADLMVLLEQSRSKNARLDITGVLLYKDGNVMQLLEGPDQAVGDLIKTIYADQRHHGIIQLLRKRVETREFPDWSMDFRNLGGANIQKVAEFLNENALEVKTAAPHQSPMLRLLSGFGFSG
jgi:acylphosphatase